MLKESRIQRMLCILEAFSVETIKNKKSEVQKPRYGRKEATRTPDPYVPNVVRYQLRYFPIVSGAKVETFC